MPTSQELFEMPVMSEPSSTPRNPLIGTWKLLSAIAILPDGTIDSEVYGPHPSGYITYTPDGYMMVMFARSDRAPFSRDVRSPFSDEIDSVPVEELALAFIGFNAYAGRYAVDGNTVTHYLEVASIPNRVGTKLVRTFTISDNRIALRTPEASVDGVTKVFELVWESIEIGSGTGKMPIPQEID
ncbi:MAG: lipocalin-like domain-containing protein [Cyanosarcina radialis HA8281-LM2]|nr:lipocalin-like domain-containing protein [Cyanosarcina radialis HA8281-LM2]